MSIITLELLKYSVLSYRLCLKNSIYHTTFETLKQAVLKAFWIGGGGTPHTPHDMLMQAHREGRGIAPTHLQLGRIVQGAGWALGPVWMTWKILPPPPPGFDSRTVQHRVSLYQLHHPSHHFTLYRNKNLASYLTLNTNPNISKKDGYKILIVAKGASKYTKNSIGIAPEWSWYLMYLVLHH